MDILRFTIDNREYTAAAGLTVSQAARENGVFIPGLCDFPGLTPAGTCRVCTCRINGRYGAACTTKLEEGMVVENDTEVLRDIRKAIIEMLYVEGNHQCAVCEKSGDCELQALAYRYRIMVPRFPYQFPLRRIETPHPKIMIDTNRCIQCMRCVRGVTTPEGSHVFRMKRSERELVLTIPESLAKGVTDEIAAQAVSICPVGAILGHGAGYAVPIGQRRFDTHPIGNTVPQPDGVAGGHPSGPAEGQHNEK